MFDNLYKQKIEDRVPEFVLNFQRIASFKVSTFLTLLAGMISRRTVTKVGVPILATVVTGFLLVPIVVVCP